MLSCRDVTELVTDYLERTLPWRRRLSIRLHLRKCDACRRYIDQMRKTIRLLAGRPLPAPPTEIEERVIARASEPGSPP
jgi:predicted anti-sigma-YlaC factor YlaD